MEIVRDILKKKELKHLDYDFVAEKVNSLIHDLDRIKNKRSRKYKDAVKAVRAHLREIYGVFILKDYDKKENLLLELGKADSRKKKELADKILLLHQSTAERLKFYSQIYKKIFLITGKPKKILDLGCGLNPCSYHYLGCSPEYIASDLSAKDCAYLNTFFETMHIKGKAFPFDLIKFHATKFLEHITADVCFLFKVIDPLESQKHDFTGYLIRNLPCKWLAVSFSTRSIGGRKEIKKERRAWFEKLLKQAEYHYETFEICSELFYIIKK